MTARVKINSASARRLLLSEEVLAELLARGTKIASAAGPGFRAVPLRQRRERAGVRVEAATAAARRAQATDNVLVKALEAGR